MKVPCIGGSADGEWYDYHGDPELNVPVFPKMTSHEALTQALESGPGNQFLRTDHYRIHKIYCGSLDNFYCFWLHYEIPEENGAQWFIDRYRNNTKGNFPANRL